jgi:hypothetical protein
VAVSVLERRIGNLRFRIRELRDDDSARDESDEIEKGLCYLFIEAGSGNAIPTQHAT